VGLLLSGAGCVALGVSTTQAQTFGPTPGPYTANIYAAVRYGYDPLLQNNLNLGSVEFMALSTPRWTYTPISTGSDRGYATLSSYGRISQIPLVDQQRLTPITPQRLYVMPRPATYPEMPFGFRYLGPNHSPSFVR